MDEIPAKFLKEAADELADPLSRTINLSVKLSVFPEEHKIAKLKPLLKKDSKTDPKICKPILLLPLVFKSIKMSIHYQLQDPLNGNRLLHKYHSGFRANFSTDFTNCFPQICFNRHKYGNVYSHDFDRNPAAN